MPGNPRLYRRDPGTSRPHGGQIRAVWAWIAELRKARTDAPAVEGAYRAAEWAIGVSNVPPVTGVHYLRPWRIVDTAFTHANEDDLLRPMSTASLAREINAAADQAETSPDPNRAAYALGAYSLLAWWAGTAELPEQLVPNPEALIPAQARSA